MNQIDQINHPSFPQKEWVRIWRRNSGVEAITVLKVCPWETGSPKNRGSTVTLLSTPLLFYGWIVQLLVSLRVLTFKLYSDFVLNVWYACMFMYIHSCCSPAEINICGMILTYLQGHIPLGCSLASTVFSIQVHCPIPGSFLKCFRIGLLGRKDKVSIIMAAFLQDL